MAGAAVGHLRGSSTAWWAQERDPTIDPIEDFVTKHPQGHCEYFATALTLMLRSLGIPARVVSGFKCDEGITPAATIRSANGTPTPGSKRT